MGEGHTIAHLCAYGNLRQVDIDGIGGVKYACRGQWQVGDRLHLRNAGLAAELAHEIYS